MKKLSYILIGFGILAIIGLIFFIIVYIRNRNVSYNDKGFCSIKNEDCMYDIECKDCPIAEEYFRRNEDDTDK